MLTEAKTRSVVKRIKPGTTAACESCGEWVKFIAGQKSTNLQVIENKYEDGKWVGVAHFHQACYDGVITTEGPA